MGKPFARPDGDHSRPNKTPARSRTPIAHAALRMFVFMILMGLEVDAKACRDGRSKEMYVRAEEEQPAAADDKEQVIR